MRASVALAIATLTLLCIGKAASATEIADLSSDWSNTANANSTNPNGIWEYRSGTSDLPLVPVWTANGTGFIGANQPAWAPSNIGGQFIPAEFKVNANAVTQFGADPHNVGHDNVLPGDVVMHTQDPYNGVGQGQANYLFTSNVSGSVTISGMVWDAGLDGSRPQDWRLLLNGTSIDNGSLDGLISRSQADTFNLTETLAVGSTVELEIQKASTSVYGYFVGAALNISTAQSNGVPEPTSFLLFGIGLAMFGLIGCSKITQGDPGTQG